MAFYLGTVELPTQKKQQMVDITARVRAEVKSSGVQNGLCTVFAPHSTGAVQMDKEEQIEVGSGEERQEELQRAEARLDQG